MPDLVLPPPTTTGSIRSEILTGYAEFARANGLDPLQQLQAAHIDPQWLTGPDHMIPMEAVGWLLDNSARDAQLDDFGLRLSAIAYAASRGWLVLVTYRQPTVSQAMQAAIRYLYLFNEAMSLMVEPSSDFVILRLEYRLHRWLPSRQLTEASMGVVYRNLQLLIGGDWQAHLVCFRHSRTLPMRQYQQAFATRIEFDSEFDCIVCRQSDVQGANRLFGQAAGEYVQHYLQLGESAKPADLVDKVRRVIWALLSGGRCTAALAASELCLHRRTLDRQLTRLGTSFATLHNEVRAELAVRHLSSSTRSLGEIADMLGFGSLSDFSNWFGRHFGCTAGNWRKQHSAFDSSH